MLKIVETLAGKTTERPIDLDKLPITIGRGSSTTYRMAQDVDPREPYFRSLSRVHATLYRQGEDIWLQDGGEQASANGIFVAGKRINRPIRLYEGAEVDLVLEAEGYGLKIIWNSRQTYFQDFPTLQFEREVLKEDSIYAESKIEELRLEIQEIQALLKRVQHGRSLLNRKIQMISQDLANQKSVNVRQDKRLQFLRRVLWWSAMAVLGITWIFLGGDAESLEIFGKGIVSLIAAISAVASFVAKDD